jgi:glycosyltransferase involved in cell wall biosynthesis
VDRFLEACDILLVRAPSFVGMAALHRADRRPYGLEVNGDPWDMYRPGSVEVRGRALYRVGIALWLRRKCRRASAVAYVTRSHLQSRFPPGRKSFVTNYSSVELHEEDFVVPAKSQRVTDALRVVSVGDLRRMRKGMDVLIDALERLHGTVETSVTLTIVGDGECRARLEKKVADAGLKQSVEFAGNVGGRKQVRGILDESSVFALASRQEGLPRAMLEAMARGLPCVGSRVGGIPELLEDRWCVPAEDPTSLAKKLEELVQDPALRYRVGCRNLDVARGYREEVLQSERQKFWQELIAASE